MIICKHFYFCSSSFYGICQFVFYLALIYNRTPQIKSIHLNLSAITSNDDTNSIKRNFYLNA